MSIFISSCGIFKRAEKSKIEKSESSKIAKLVLSEAKSYTGTPYKFGGNDKTGIDCSGLVKNSFKKADIELPRRSAEQQHAGKEIALDDCKAGDLIFFNTSKNKSKEVNHVGIISHVKKTEILFIHASTKKGVMESSLEEPFFKNSFVKIVRIF
ncbi:MAG: C40 family peptidase [Bacteroidota bacterium]|jgi:cell wall-associated NlpC family hydrolase